MHKIIFLFVLLGFLYSCTENQQTPGFAIVIDSESYKQAENEVREYAASVETDGLKTIVVIDKWNHPDSIKAELMDLYKDKIHPLEGVVFIGDIPVAMIRDGQHFTSAFKMDQKRYAWERSSVPSDRFYDDFDLKFEYIKKDSTNRLFHYYSLTPESSQKLHPEIYSGRIKPFESECKYEDLKKYLKKVVRLKSEANELDQLLYFGGHGYNSESMIARMDEKISLLDHFPWLNRQQNGISYIDHATDVHVKHRLMSELQRDDLDFAILHHHGGDDAEYLNGMPKVDNVTAQIEGVKRYLRSKLRSAKRRRKNIAETKKYYQKQMKVPSDWFDGSFDQDVKKKDSLFNANLDIVMEDFTNYVPNARLIILDACFNGSFHLDRYLAGAYLFNDGNTIAVQANSVNALQDKWSNEFVGLLGLGMRVGEWSKQVAYLESHVLGDPTYRFKLPKGNKTPDIVLPSNKADDKFLLGFLGSEFPDVQSFALRKLYENNYPDISALLLKSFKTSSHGTVRMECLKLLTAVHDNNFIECVSLACNDSYEFVRRQAVYLIGKSGDDRLINPLLSVLMRNNTSKRIDFTVNQALYNFSKDKLMKNFDLMFASTSFSDADKAKVDLIKSIDYATNRWKKTVEELLDPKSSVKSVKSDIRSLRNYNYHPGVEEFCKFAKYQDNEELQITMLEALGWFNISWKKELIIKTCDEIYSNNSFSSAVKNEALKTSKRLKTPWYR